MTVRLIDGSNLNEETQPLIIEWLAKHEIDANGVLRIAVDIENQCFMVAVLLKVNDHATLDVMHGEAWLDWIIKPIEHPLPDVAGAVIGYIPKPTQGENE